MYMKCIVPMEEVVEDTKMEKKKVTLKKNISRLCVSKNDNDR